MLNHRIIVGDVIESLRSLPDSSVSMCVTSPPYFGLRNYEIEPSSWGDGWFGCLGNEPTPDQYIDHIVEVFREVKRVMAEDGTLWLNLGDSYAGSGKGPGGKKQQTNYGSGISVDERGYFQNAERRQGFVGSVAKTYDGIKAKDLIGIPWMAAFALRHDGWYLRQDIIWAKPNPMPESVTDRCTRSHEYLFMLSKSRRYYYDAKSVLEPCSPKSDFGKPRPNTPMMSSLARYGENRHRSRLGSGSVGSAEGRNKRDVWTVATSPYKGAHFATFPPKLIEPCILAGSAAGDTVLDPFGGAGTTSVVAAQLGRSSIYIDRSPQYAELAKSRLAALDIQSIHVA